MDLSRVAASVITFLQATEAAISVWCDYRFTVKESSWEIPQVLEEVRDLLRTLKELAEMAETPVSANESRLPALK